MNIIKPKPLIKGATIGFLTVSGAIEEFDKVEKAKKYFEEKGYSVVLSDTTYMKKGFLSADDDVRLAQLHEFFADANIDAILCTRGGYGAIRLLKRLDYSLIKQNPKIFAGFSDATAFLTAISSNTGLITYHSPMPYSDFGEEMVSTFTETSFFEILGGAKFETTLYGNVYNTGTAEGVLWGGNLATLASMVGVNFVPDEKFILFLEDIDEPAYKIDRYLTQLMFDRKFAENISGIVLGEFTGLDDEVEFEQVFDYIGKKLYIPVISGLKIGHVKDKLSVPIGVKALLDTEEKILREK